MQTYILLLQPIPPNNSSQKVSGMLGYKSEQAQKESRYYLRFHQTIRRAIEFNQQLYGDKTGKDGKEFKYEHPLRVAGMTEDIGVQSLYDYHLNWLVGVLHDSKEDDPVKFSEDIDAVLQDLLPAEKEQVLNYIDQLSKDRTIPKGLQKKEQVDRMDSLDIVPSYIKIFDKFDNCRRFLKNGVGKSQMELNGYFAVAIICYDCAIKKHKDIEYYLSASIKQFFKNLRARFGTEKAIQDCAEKYYAI